MIKNATTAWPNLARRFLPNSTHDRDGNLASMGEWLYRYDAMHRAGRSEQWLVWVGFVRYARGVAWESPADLYINLKMDTKDIIGDGVIAIILTGGCFCLFFIERITRRLHIEYPEEWERMGAPGGYFWRPPGRKWGENYRRTRRFWLAHMLSFDELRKLSPSIYRNYVAYKLILGIGLAVLIAGEIVVYTVL